MGDDSVRIAIDAAPANNVVTRIDAKHMCDVLGGRNHAGGVAGGFLTHTPR
ncbi:hypothetical protein EES39_39000 [Streptomyces sp. ADI92-24]|nr:hypothetical protein EES39_39000 [Streptomyces sp. ADI92-24]